MKLGKRLVMFALPAVAWTLGLAGPVRAEEAAKGDRKPATFWTLPKESDKVTLVIAGQKDPLTVTVSDATVFAGICLHCSIPLEFKPGESAKNCNVCGCEVSNAACIVGNPVKSNTWQEMLKLMPHGTVFWTVFNDPAKPESGVKRLTVDLRAVLLPVTGLESQTPDQLLALVKPLGGSKAELLDGGKLLSVSLKSDWTTERAAKLEKALAKINAKISVPEEPKAAQ